jgi:hypothetical protein
MLLVAGVVFTLRERQELEVLALAVTAEPAVLLELLQVQPIEDQVGAEVAETCLLEPVEPEVPVL